jgi:HD-like signal output (HDOD) protein
MMARFWDVSEKRANAMTCMAKRSRLIAPEVAHGFGLFCDIGIPILKSSFPTYLATLALANREASTRFTEIERSRHGIDHAVVGAMLAQEWDLDADIILAIRLHHSYDALRDAAIAAEVRAMIAANLVVEKAIQEFRKESSSLEWQVGGDAAMETLGLDHNEIEQTCHELKQLF